MAGTPSSQSDNAAGVTGRLQEFTGPGEPDVVFVDLDNESFGGETLGTEAPFAVRQASTTTPGVGSWLRDRYPGVELGRPMIFGAMAGLFVTVGVLAWLSFGGDDMIALDEAPASGSATADGSGGRGVFANDGSTSNFTSSASKRLSRASGAAGKEEALAGLQARRELREQAEEAEAAAAETDGNTNADNSDLNNTDLDRSDPDSADPDSGDSAVAAPDPDGDGSAVDDDSDGSVDAPGSTNDDGSTSDDGNVAGPSVTTDSGNTTPTSAGSQTTIGSNQTTSSVRGTVSTSGSTPTSTQQTTPTTRATSTTPTSTVSSSQPTSSTPTSSATSTPTTASTTTSSTASTTTTTEATTTSTTAPPPPATDLIVSPANGSTHSTTGSVTFNALFTPGATEYCWRFSSGIRGNNCESGTGYTVSGSDFSAGTVTVTATARDGNEDVLAREVITITFVGTDEEPEQPEEIDDDEGGGSNPGRGGGGGRRPL